MSFDINQFLDGIKDPNNINRTINFIKGIRSPIITVEKYLKLYAAKGNVEAQLTLGSKYYTGDGVEQSYPEAVKYYQQAAEQGLSYAQNILGVMYERGEGVKQSYPEALKYYQQAADQGDSDAQIKLGNMYYQELTRAETRVT